MFRFFNNTVIFLEFPNYEIDLFLNWPNFSDKNLIKIQNFLITFNILNKIILELAKTSP